MKIRCRVTGFTGIATSKIEYINGCVQFCITPQMHKKTGKVEDGRWTDVGQIDIVGNGIQVELVRTGGPAADAPRNGYRG